MRRLLLIFGMVVAFLISPLLAQMHGGRSGSFGRPSFGGHGHSFGGRGFGSNHFGPRFGGGFGPRFHGGFGPRFGGRFCRFCGGGFFPRDRFFFGFSSGFAYPYYGFYGAYGYPWYGGYAYPGYSYPAVAYSDSRYNSDLDYSYQQKRNMEELDRLEDRVQRLENQRAAANVPRPPQYEAQARPASPIVLVFRDKHSQETENYAIVGQTIWLFNEQRATRIPMSEIDIPATQKANEERGVQFEIPNTR
jgi:hypothetical protein